MISTFSDAGMAPLSEPFPPKGAILGGGGLFCDLREDAADEGDGGVERLALLVEPSLEAMAADGDVGRVAVIAAMVADLVGPGLDALQSLAPRLGGELQRGGALALAVAL